MRTAAIVALLAAGIMAGAQLGKIAPLVPWYRSEAGFSLVSIGWLTALIAVFVAIAALPAGWAIQRFGTRQASILSFILLAAGGVALAFANTPAAVLLARLLEGIGYLALVIAVPALLSEMSPAGWRASVMAVWGGFVPIGFAVANYLAAAVIPAAGERGFLLIATLAFAVFAVPAIPLVLRTRDANGSHSAQSNGAYLKQSLGLPIVLLSLAFGAYVISSIGFFTFMPAFVQETGDRFVVSAGFIALMVPVGNLIAGVLLHGRDARAAAMLAGLGFVISVLFSVPAFASVNTAVATAAAIAIAIAGGIIASALFAAIPVFVPRGGSVSMAIGLVAQAGGIGTLLGPPLAGAIIERYSWWGLGAFLSVAALAGLVCVAPLVTERTQRA